MNIQTLRFGTIEYTEQQTLHFKGGLIGFPALTHFVLLESQSSPLVMWLQSIICADVALPVVEACVINKSFNVQLNVADKMGLEFTEGDLLKTLVILTIPEDPLKMTANMKAPLVLNVTKQKAIQAILQDKELHIKTPAYRAISGAFSNYKISQSAKNVEGSVVWQPVTYLAKSHSAGV